MTSFETPFEIPLPPNSMIGILGGGQLGRFLAMAAADLGFGVHIYDPDPDCPAARIAQQFTCAPYGDLDRLKRFAETVNLVTYEFESIALESVEFLERSMPVVPSSAALKIGQDRWHEKNFARMHGITTPDFLKIKTIADLRQGLETITMPAILKTRRDGYDGKGQRIITDVQEAREAWMAIGQRPCILESKVDFERELSVIIVRDYLGRTQCYPVVENHHRRGMLHQSFYPPRIDDKRLPPVKEHAKNLIQALDYVGVMTVELFVTRSGALLFNELAPRVHNSGHWTIEGVRTSQFENHIRAICGLPLGDVTPLGEAEMTNLIGEDILNLQQWLDDPRSHLHLYGKKEIRAGRKMGHVTKFFPYRHKKP